MGELKVGDVVRLKGSEVRMTVIKVIKDKLLTPSGCIDLYLCDWFDDISLNSYLFKGEDLILIEEGE